MIKTIKTRLILTVSMIVMLSIASVSAIVYQQNIKKIESLLGQKVESIAKTSATLISGDDHQKIVENIQGAQEMPEWTKLQKALARVKKENDLQEDVYTMMDVYWIEANKENPYGQVMFTAMATSETFQPKGQKKEKYVHESMKSKKAGHTDIFQTINGFFITGYAPIITSKGVVTAVIEVALEVGKEIHQARMNLIKGILSAALAVILIAILITVFASQKISSPIKKLTGVVLKMSGGDLQARVEGIKTNDEIQILGEGFNEMAVNLERSYKELENYSKNLEKMVAERTAELAAANRKITAILNNMKLGVFAVDKDQVIQPPASAYCETIFQKDVVGTDIMNTLFSSMSDDDPAKAAIESANIAVYGEDDFQWGLMEMEYPTEITAKNPINGDDQYLEIKYSPLWDEDGNLSELLYVVDDVTELKKLQKEAEKARQEGELTNQVLMQLSNIETTSLEGHFSNFRTMMDAITTNISSWSNISKIFIDLHTVKGNSRVLGLELIAKTIHQIEAQFNHLKNNDSIGEEEKQQFLKVIEESLLVFGKYNGLAEKIFKIKNFFRFPDTSKYFYYLTDYIANGETSRGVIQELHDFIPESIPVDAITEDEENMKITNWEHVLNSNLANLILFKGYDRFSFSVASIEELLQLENSVVKGETISDITGASYFTHAISKLKEVSGDLNSLIREDIRSISSLIILGDFIVKATKEDYKNLRKITSDSASSDELVNYMSTTPGTLIYLLRSKGKEQTLNFVREKGIDLNIFSAITKFTKEEFFTHLENLKVSWNKNNRVVEFENSQLLEQIGMSANISDKIDSNSLDQRHYHSMRSIFTYSILTQLNHPLSFYTPDESMSIQFSPYQQFSNWFESNINDEKAKKALTDIHRPTLAEFMAPYAINIEKEALLLDKKIRVLTTDQSVPLSLKEFKSIEAPIVHLVTNSLVHGIENKKERLSKNKPTYGQIYIDSSRDENENLILRVSDDGCGLDFDSMKKAVQTNESTLSLFKEEMTDKEVFDLFLHNPLSTKQEDDLLAGRGIGLSTIGDLVSKGVATIDYETEKDKGTTFILKFIGS